MSDRLNVPQEFLGSFKTQPTFAVNRLAVFDPRLVLSVPKQIEEYRLEALLEVAVFLNTICVTKLSSPNTSSINDSNAMHILVANLDKDRAGIRQKITGNSQTITQVGRYE